MNRDVLMLHPDQGLDELLPKRLRRRGVVVYPLNRRASIKDIIEALNIPHTEINSITLNNREISFEHIPEAGERLFLHSFLPGTDLTQPSLLRPTPLKTITFMVDVNVGKLARLMRLSGLDTWYDPQLKGAALAGQAAAHNRILLSRDHDLLQRKTITWGHLVRTEQPEKQLAEIITLFGLRQAIAPFTRCPECNTQLQPVEKSTLLHRLEPLTRKYYHKFHLCPGCDRIYWRGSHHHRMKATLQRIVSGL